MNIVVQGVVARTNDRHSYLYISLTVSDMLSRHMRRKAGSAMLNLYPTGCASLSYAVFGLAVIHSLVWQSLFGQPLENKGNGANP